MDRRIKNTSKRGQRIAQEAARWAYAPARRAYTYESLEQAYKSASGAKWAAWYRCRDLCAKMRGYDLRIVGVTAQCFSVVFKYKERGTGRECVAYITRDYSRFAYVTGDPAAA